MRSQSRAMSAVSNAAVTKIACACPTHARARSSVLEDSMARLISHLGLWRLYVNKSGSEEKHAPGSHGEPCKYTTRSWYRGCLRRECSLYARVAVDDVMVAVVRELVHTCSTLLVPLAQRFSIDKIHAILTPSLFTGIQKKMSRQRVRAGMARSPPGILRRSPLDLAPHLRRGGRRARGAVICFVRPLLPTGGRDKRSVVCSPPTHFARLACFGLTLARIHHSHTYDISCTRNCLPLPRVLGPTCTHTRTRDPALWGRGRRGESGAPRSCLRAKIAR